MKLFPRVLHIDTGREMRGGQFQVLLLLNALRAAGAECFLKARAASPLCAAARSAGFPVFTLYGRTPNFDLIHAHDAHAHTLAALGSRRPFVVSRRVAFPIKRSLLSQWKYRRPSRFLAVSECVASQLVEAGVPPAKIDIVYDAVDPNVAPADWHPSHPAIALASSDPAKGRDLLNGLPVTYSTDLPQDFQHASMFVYLSRSEGLGSAALLAMAMGIPVIASDIPGLREAVGDAGLLVANHPPAVAAAIQKLREDSALAQTLIKRGKQRVSERFTTQRLVDSTLAAYRRAIATP